MDPARLDHRGDACPSWTFIIAGERPSSWIPETRKLWCHLIYGNVVNGRLVEDLTWRDCDCSTSSAGHVRKEVADFCSSQRCGTWVRGPNLHPPAPPSLRSSHCGSGGSAGLPQLIALGSHHLIIRSHKVISQILKNWNQLLCLAVSVKCHPKGKVIVISRF